MEIVAYGHGYRRSTKDKGPKPQDYSTETDNRRHGDDHVRDRLTLTCCILRNPSPSQASDSRRPTFSAQASRRRGLSATPRESTGQDVEVCVLGSQDISNP